MNIDFKPVPKLLHAGNKRGERAIMVDGVQWGTVHMESYGRRGVAYYFSESSEQTSAHYIWRHGQVAVVRSNLKNLIPTTAEGLLRLADKEFNDLVTPVRIRVRQEAERLIAEGLLRHPDDVQQAADRAREKEDRLFSNRASEAIAAGGGLWPEINRLSPGATRSLNLEIIKAMRWARHQ